MATAGQEALLGYGRPLSREQFADLIGVVEATVIRWDADGLIRTVWMGGKKRIPPSEVARIVEHGVDLEAGRDE